MIKTTPTVRLASEDNRNQAWLQGQIYWKNILRSELTFFGLDTGVAEISHMVDPVEICDITEKGISSVGVDAAGGEWMTTLGGTYSEAYAQWFDSLGTTVMETLLRPWKVYRR